MAAGVRKITLGIDVSKVSLDVCLWDTGQRWHLANDRVQIAKLLKAQAGPVQISVEPTSHYHLDLIDLR